MRYSLTTVVAALMLTNGVMTLQALDCWFCRESGIAPSSPVEEFYAEHFDNAYMEHRFQSMTIHPRPRAAWIRPRRRRRISRNMPKGGEPLDTRAWRRRMTRDTSYLQARQNWLKNTDLYP